MLMRTDFAVVHLLHEAGILTRTEARSFLRESMRRFVRTLSRCKELASARVGTCPECPLSAGYCEVCGHNPEGA